LAFEDLNDSDLDIDPAPTGVVSASSPSPSSSSELGISDTLSADISAPASSATEDIASGDRLDNMDRGVDEVLDAAALRGRGLRMLLMVDDEAAGAWAGRLRRRFICDVASLASSDLRLRVSGGAISTVLESVLPL
jgi:hypothetical protein